MREVKFYSVVLMALMVLAYLSWTKKDEATKDAGKVTLLSAAPKAIEKLEFFSKTSTVKMTFREVGGERFAWFEMQGSRSPRVFGGSEKTEKFLETFAPFEALRGLGNDLSEDELKLTGLKTPERKLIITVQGKAKTFDVGQRTNGARDHYVRPKASQAVFLVASKVLSDLQFPEGKLMQRKLRNEPGTEVAKVSLSVGDLKLTALHRNRLSAKEAFWTSEKAPKTKNETLGNYLEKLEKLTASEYLKDETAFEAAEPVLEAVWFAEDGDELGRVSLRRTGTGKDATYYALSKTTRVPVKVSRFTAEALQQDAAAALSGE